MSESTIALELAEIEAIADLYRAAGPDIVADCGLSVREVGDAVLIAVTRFDVLALNRLPSFRNLRRLGFEVTYKRPNYLWVKTAPAP